MSLFSLFPSLVLCLFLFLFPAPSHGCWLSCFSQDLQFWATAAGWGKTVVCVEVCSRCHGGGCQMWVVPLAPPWSQTHCWTLRERRRQEWTHYKLIGHKTFLRTRKMRKTQQQKKLLCLCLWRFSHCSCLKE